MEGRTRLGRSTSVARSIIFDGDDTLWMTQSIYKAVIDEFYCRLVQQGFSYDEVHELFTVINQSLFDKIKLSTDRLGRAMSATYERLCRQKQRKFVRSISRELIELAHQVFVRMPEPLPQVEVILPRLAEEYELVFYSAGDETTQRNRLRGLGLDTFFQDRIHIVQQKDDVTLRSILTQRSMNPETTWIVGNSPRFELNPGLHLGLRAIWMHTSFWTFDLEDITEAKAFVAFSLAEVENIVLHGSANGDQCYQPSAVEAMELHTRLSLLSEEREVWMVGTSPKLDINPAINAGCHAIWIPTYFDSGEIEPIHGNVYVAFSLASAKHIIRRQATSGWDSAEIIYRLRERHGDLGGSLVVD